MAARPRFGGILKGDLVVSDRETWKAGDFAEICSSTKGDSKYAVTLRRGGSTALVVAQEWAAVEALFKKVGWATVDWDKGKREIQL